MADTIDDKKLAEAALALLSLTKHGNGRVWKALDWGLMDTLFQRGWITDPATKARSVHLTEEGEELAAQFLRKHFAAGVPARGKREQPRRAAPPERLDNAIALRCTAKLLDALGMSATEVPEEVAAHRQWHATLLRLDRRQCVLLTHTQTLYSVALLGVRKADLQQLGERLAARLRTSLAHEGVADVRAVLPSTAPTVIFAKTNNRSVVGSMNELAFLLQGIVARHGGVSGANENIVAAELNHTPMIAGLGGAFPADVMRELLGRATEQ